MCHRGLGTLGTDPGVRRGCQPASQPAASLLTGHCNCALSGPSLALLGCAVASLRRRARAARPTGRPTGVRNPGLGSASLSGFFDSTCQSRLHAPSSRSPWRPHTKRLCPPLLRSAGVFPRGQAWLGPASLRSVPCGVVWGDPGSWWSTPFRLFAAAWCALCCFGASLPQRVRGRTVRQCTQPPGSIDTAGAREWRRIPASLGRARGKRRNPALPEWWRGPRSALAADA